MYYGLKNYLFAVVRHQFHWVPIIMGRSGYNIKSVGDDIRYIILAEYNYCVFIFYLRYNNVPAAACAAEL